MNKKVEAYGLWVVDRVKVKVTKSIDFTAKTGLYVMDTIHWLAISGDK